MWRTLLLLMAAVLVVPACGGGSGDGGASPPGNSVAVVAFSDPAIETFPSEGSTHVPVGTVVSYMTDPPTSGNHYPDPQSGGFYTTVVAPGFLVHSMEHGGVIIYYDAAVLSSADVAALQTLAGQHPGIFAQVVAVPRSDPSFPLILTAWTHRLRLTSYEQSRIDGFLTLFLGQGPEKE